jgi:hypothetical protein
LGKIEKTIVRAFGIGGITAMERQMMRPTQQIKGIQNYNSS